MSTKIGLGMIVSTAWIFILAVGTAGAGAGALRMDFTPSFAEKFSQNAPWQKEYTVKRCSKAPVIDGQLDDECWKSLPAIELMGGEPGTRVMACYDAQNLYLAFECLVKEGQPPKFKPRDRDSDVWEDDAIEICAASKSSRNYWYHFIISAANAVFDQKMCGSSQFGVYDPEFQHAVRIEDKRWIVEVAMPAKALELDKWPVRLGFSVGRDGPATGPHFWTTVRRDVSITGFNFDGVSATADKQEQQESFVSNQPAEGKALGVYLDRSYARPGERWIEVECNIKPAKLALDKTRFEAKVYPGIGQTKAVESFSVVPQRNRGRLEIDLRSLKLERAKVVAEVYEGEERTGACEFWLTVQPCETPFEGAKKVAVPMDLPAGLSKKEVYPVTFGVPLPAGAVWDIEGLRLVDKDGKVLPQQKALTGRWAPEGAVKWVRFDALASPDKGCFVEMDEVGRDRRSRHGGFGPSSLKGFAEASETALPLKLTEKDGKIEIDAGVAKYVLAKGISPVEQVWVGGKAIATSAGARGLYLIDQKGRLASAVAEEETMVIESSGPVAACVRFEGWYKTEKSESLARHVTRVECFAGEAAAQITHSLVLTEDTNEIWFKEIGWEFALADKEAGRAIFGIDREDPGKKHEIKLSGRQNSAYMLQDSHYFFGHGTNHFEVGVMGGEGKRKIELEGMECGDYAALAGKESGLALICRDTARQHPKEFEVSPGKINLKLFSPSAGSTTLLRHGSGQVTTGPLRTGEELDFRAQTLIKKWDLVNWVKHAPGDLRGKDVEKEMKNYVSNAAGWSKTHLIRIAPLSGGEADETLKRETLKLKHPVYGFIDPRWLYETRVMGPLYPRDKDRFPETEEMVEAYFRKQLEADAKWGENGFIDYAAGPEFFYYYGKMWPELRRNGLTYLLRPGLWLLYARSGDRAVREFAEDTNRTCMDARHGQWNTSVSRKGMLRWAGDFPFYWAPGAHMEYGNTTSLDHLIWQYYLTGYRRAGDVMRDFSAGIKQLWSPRAALHPTYPANILWHLAQCYGFTYDRQIRDLADAMMDLLEDPEGALGFNKYANARDTTYKGSILVRGYITAWELIGEIRFHRMAQAYADHMVRRNINHHPVGYVPSLQFFGAFRYDETRDPMLAEVINCQVRWATGNYLPEQDDFLNNGFYCAASSTFLTEIGYALHVVAQSEADKKPLVSWLAYEDTGQPTALFLQKSENGKIKIYYHAPGVVEGSKPFSVLKSGSGAGVDLFQMTTEASGDVLGSISFPKDMAGYTYRMAFTGTGEHWFFGDSRFPFVFFAPGYWYPIPVQRPAAKYFFRLEKDNQDAQIFFEGPARLFEPSGGLFPSNGVVSGWVDLPKEKAGLWAFEPAEYKLVKTRNVPPFFAVRDSGSHFIPEGVAWEREPKPAPMEAPTNSAFGAGAIEKSGDQALYLMGKRAFQIMPGPDRSDGDGGAFLPLREGTIEFFLRPSWSSAELPDQTKRFLFAPLDAKSKTPGSDYLTSEYRLAGKDKTLDFLFNTSFKNTDLEQGATIVRVYRVPTFFEKGEWTHLANTWGRRNNITYHPTSDIRGDNVMTGEIYVNGRMGHQSGGKRNSGKNSWLAGPMAYLQVGLMHQSLTNLDMAIDELRISDIRRYKDDFKPPSRDEEFKVDGNTRALFHFNGNLDGECWGDGEKPNGKITN